MVSVGDAIVFIEFVYVEASSKARESGRPNQVNKSPYTINWIAFFVICWCMLVFVMNLSFDFGRNN